jgi:hypothetical protein
MQGRQRSASERTNRLLVIMHHTAINAGIPESGWDGVEFNLSSKTQNQDG